MGTRYLPHTAIDKSKWDHCIDHATNGLIYARSVYLDAMAEHWDAIVLNDYEAVMPLTWRKKWGIRYLYQPAFIQQAGIFFLNKCDRSVQQSFMDHAFKEFRFAEITFNHLNQPSSNHNCQLSLRNNFVLPLYATYEETAINFSTGTKKNIRRAVNRGLYYQAATEYVPILRLYQELYANRLPHFSPSDYANFLRLCAFFSKENNLVVRRVINQSDSLLAAVVMLRYRGRLYNIISCVTSEGRKEEANYFLYNELIKEFSGSDHVLDFEGSEVKGIADFYSGFAPQIEKYAFVKMNKLPFPLRLFKK